MIYGERIRLRKIEREDLPHYVKWFNDPEVRRGVMMSAPISQVEEEQWFENTLKRPTEERPLAIEIREGDGWRLVGSAGFFDIDWRVRSAEFGISIGDKTVWDQGYGTEATRLMLLHGFETLNLNRIQLRVYDTNPRAIRAYQKAGYTHEGVLRQAQFLEGRYVDMHVMSVLRAEWVAAK